MKTYADWSYNGGSLFSIRRVKKNEKSKERRFARHYKQICRGGGILALLVLAFAGCNSGIDDADGDTGGDDTSTEGYTYTVSTADELLEWNKAVQNDLSLNITLAADINLTNSDYEWLPVGSSTSPYTGTFDGGSYAITGLTVSQSGVNYAGLIAYLGSEGKVQNLTLNNVSITGGYFVGAVAGWNSGDVTACYHATGSVSGSSSSNVGAIAGRNDGDVTACYWSGDETDGIGFDNSTGSSAEKVTSDDWTSAVNSMNNAISSTSDWQYALSGGSLPTLAVGS